MLISTLSNEVGDTDLDNRISADKNVQSTFRLAYFGTNVELKLSNFLKSNNELAVRAKKIVINVPSRYLLVQS